MNHQDELTCTQVPKSLQFHILALEYFAVNYMCNISPTLLPSVLLSPRILEVQ